MSTNERMITYAEALNEALKEEMEKNEDIILLGEDIGPYGGVFNVTKGLFERYGAERVIDTPISEAGFAGAGIGAAMTGLKPIVEFMWIDFTFVAMDQILNQGAKMAYMSGGQTTVPIVFRTQGGGGRGNAAQHSQSLETIFAHVPGMKVVLPSSPYDAKGLLKTAIRENCPVMFIENKLLYNTKGHVPEEEYTIAFGQANVLVEGEDITMVSISRSVHLSLEAAEALKAEGIHAEVIDLRTLVPLDIETIKDSVKKTNRLIIVHEAAKSFGWGAELAAQISEEVFDYLDAPVYRIGAKDTPIPYNMKLEKEVLPKVEDIVDDIKKSLYMKEGSK
ncbi:alpha-ketoacid dehydrogenase subunit beta [Sporosarcina sp. FSL W7-1349]|uniref:alpha-ketoacid dehydrogenase subunit beta n=1 Tax=Sporosarcina sp. FSL W7-1349 TaxID=2921561 RepID=UPI0030FAF74C